MADAGIIVAGLALAGTLVASFMTYKSSKNATRVGLEANAFQRAVQAEEKAEQANRRADACNRRMQAMENNLVRIESRFRYVILMIHDPYTSIEMLRERVPLNFNSHVGDE